VNFAAASAVRGGDGSWAGRLADGWDIFGVTNGGYGLTLATKAMAAEADGRGLMSVSALYVNPSSAGPVQIDVETLKRGRSTTALRAAVRRADKVFFHATAVFAERNEEGTSRDLLAGDPPQLPPPQECFPLTPTDSMPYPPEFHGNVDVRLHPDDAAAFLGEHSRLPSFRGWFRLRGDEALDAHAVIMATDAFPPAIFNSSYSPGWTPTVELSVQIREPNPSGWMACRFATRFVTGDMLEEDGEVWDKSGRLVALSRQLALVPRQGAT